MKNKFLLLGATALLSTASAANVWAEGSPKGTVAASISIVDPFTITNDYHSLSFPTISRKNPAGSGKITVVMKPDGTIDTANSNAQFVNGTSSNNSEEGFLTLEGGWMATESFGVDDGDTSTEEYFVSISYSMDSTIDMIDTDNGNVSCGTLKNLTHLWKYNKPSTGNPYVELRFGGTFEMNDLYQEATETCSGSAEITFFSYL